MLSKPEKKDLYDRHGIQGLKEGMGGGGGSDFFEDLFGGFMGGRGGPFGGFGGLLISGSFFDDVLVLRTFMFYFLDILMDFEAHLNL